MCLKKGFFWFKKLNQPFWNMCPNGQTIRYEMRERPMEWYGTHLDGREEVWSVLT